MRMRSPSSAPPPRRRVGSTATTAMRRASARSSRNRRTSSSVSDDLPEPPVPVMPTTGTVRSAPAARQGRQLVRAVGAGLERGDGPGQDALAAVPAAQRRQVGPVDGREVDVGLGDDRVDHRRQPETLAVVGREDAGDAVGVQLLDLVGHDHAPAAAVDPHVGPPLGPQAVEQVTEVLDVAALVGADRHGLHVLLHRSPHDLVDRPVVPEVDHLGALALEDPPHDVDRGVVAVEQAGRGHHAHRVDRHVDGGRGCDGRAVDEGHRAYS